MHASEMIPGIDHASGMEVTLLPIPYLPSSYLERMHKSTRQSPSSSKIPPVSLIVDHHPIQARKAIMKANIVALLALVGVAASSHQPLALVERRASPPGALARCKCYPGEACWPSTADWGNLNRTVGGRLVKAAPPGAVCYDSFEGVPTRDPAKCAEVASQWSNASWT